MNVNPLRIERLLRMAVVPFLSIGALVGTGFSFWVFTTETEADPVSAKGTLTVAALAQSAQISLKLPAYDQNPGDKMNDRGYRLVFDQGGESFIYDTREGVYIEPGIVCQLSDYQESFLSTYMVSYAFEIYGYMAEDPYSDEEAKLHCPAYRRCTLTDASKRPQILFPSGAPEPTSSGILEFSLKPEFQWLVGQKPATSVSWATFINEWETECVGGTDHTHVLTITISSGAH